MFVQPCTTSSTLRKVISHIFGRDKLCTKSILPGTTAGSGSTTKATKKVPCGDQEGAWASKEGG